MTRAVKEKRRPPFTTLATRLIVTTRSRYALFSAAGPRPSRRSRRSPPAPPPRRCAPGITGSSSQLFSSELQASAARAIGQCGDAAAVLVAAAVEHDGRDAGLLGA